MTTNRAGYGFRFYRSKYGRPLENCIRKLVASNATFSVTGGATAVGLGAGDPVKLVNDGTVMLANGAETTPDDIWGVVVGVGPYWDGTLMQQKKVLPSNAVWGTNMSRASYVWVVPIEQAYWEIDADDATTATTEAAYMAFIGENVSMVLTGASGELRAAPKVDISTHATTNSLKLRIFEISTTADNVDYAGLNVKVVVEVNANSTITGWATTSTGV
jgi:hypothetical protein